MWALVIVLGLLHRVRTSLELITCCVGEVCTVRRNGAPWPLIYGIAVNVKTGDIFPAQFTDKVRGYWCRLSIY
jgi:protein N-terminal asparagine amidohydrolase